jgi:polysaccharide biosynthesis transport protein
MEVAEIWRVLRREWLAAAAVFVLAMAGTLGLVLLPSPTYQSAVTLAVSPAAPRSGGAVPNVQIVQFLMPALQARVESRTLAADVERSIGPTDTSTSASVDPGTGLLTITSSGAAADVQRTAAAFASALIRTQSTAENSPVEIGVLDPASPPAKTRGRGLATILTGLVLALSLSVLTAVVVHRMRRPRGLAAEVTRHLGFPVLGEIPRFRTSDRVRLQPSRLYEEGDSLAVEALMRLRTGVEIQVQARKLTSVSVVSRDAGEGKSTVAMHVAWTLAAVGHQICLVEADLRRPSLVRYLGDGVADVEGPADPRHAADGMVLRTALPKLWFVPSRMMRRMAGDKTPGQQFELHPTDVTGLVLPGVIESGVQDGQLVVLDLPPLSGAAEASLAVSMTQVVVLVVDARRKDVMESLEESVQLIQEAGGVVLGIVLNRARVSRRRRRQMASYHVALRSVDPAFDDRGRSDRGKSRHAGLAIGAFAEPEGSVAFGDTEP